MSINQIDVTGHQWQVIANPNALGKKCLAHWREISDNLESKGIRHELHKAEGCGQGIETAQRLCQEGKRHLMVVGGDGTINEVVNGIMQSGVNPNEVFLAVLPLGRGNDWARSHRYHKDYGHNLDLFRRGRFIQHDVGVVTTLDGGREINKRHFINIAGFGFDAEVIYDVVYNRPRFLGISVYILGLIRALFGYKSVPVKVDSGDMQYEGNSFLLVAGLGQYNGGGIRQVPMAVPDDGNLAVVLIPEVSVFTILTNFVSMFKGKHIQKIKGIRTCSTARVEIHPSELFRAEVEGELLPTGDYRIEVIPQALNVLTGL